MGDRVPGPTCTTRVGTSWIDVGTLCRARMGSPGPSGVGGAVVSLVMGAILVDAQKAKYDKEHIYSMAPEAARKRTIDLQIIGGDYSRGKEIRIDNESYLKQLIEIGSGGRQRVGVDKRGRLQFFIIRGGGEGFLPDTLAGENAGDVVETGTTTDGKKTLTFRFDVNDLLVVFDSKGNLISSARLERPVSITDVWTRKTANKVYDSWGGREVFIYRNTRFNIPYLGLGVDDPYRGHSATVDMHKQEDTNGCIFIVDPNTPNVDDKDIAKFEPKLIHDVLASVGKSPSNVKERVSLGVMHLLEIK
jgi:hypothetical protein